MNNQNTKQSGIDKNSGSDNAVKNNDGAEQSDEMNDNAKTKNGSGTVDNNENEDQ